jgi:hypothetical protein
VSAHSHGGWRAALRRVLGRTAPAVERGAKEDAPAPPAAPLSPEEALEQLRAMANAPTAQARFVCARHGTEAAVVTLYRRFGGQDSSVIVESGLGRGWHRIPTPDDEATFGHPVAEAVEEALARANAIELHLVDPRFTPFFCTGCAAVYCGQCWQIREIPDPDLPGWTAELRATCPQGHEQVLG